MKKGYKRSDRVGELLRQEIAQILQREAKDPLCRDATVTEVVPSEDLRHARVYFSAGLGGSAPEEVQKALERSAPFLRRELKGRMDMRQVPELTFHYDESIDRGAKMDELLTRIAKKEGRG
ncbi:MAG: 30S ribosome-binding factor RbfA [Bdellovibrionota bacterium]